MTTNSSKDPFLQRVRVTNEDEAIANSLAAALKRNRVYARFADNKQRAAFRESWKREIIRHSNNYGNPVSDSVHIETIASIAETMSHAHRKVLNGERLRFGTSQKAFNLHLKFLWRLGKIPMPPHCPVDGIALRSAKIYDAWTKSDSPAEYQKWIDGITATAGTKSISQCEYDLWNQAP